VPDVPDHNASRTGRTFVVQRALDAGCLLRFKLYLCSESPASGERETERCAGLRTALDAGMSEAMCSYLLRAAADPQVQDMTAARAMSFLRGETQGALDAALATVRRGRRSPTIHNTAGVVVVRLLTECGAEERRRFCALFERELEGARRVAASEGARRMDYALEQIAQLRAWGRTEAP
jgi:hypothetical protein